MWQIIRRNPSAMIGLAILIFFALMATVGPQVIHYDTTENPLLTYQPPSLSHWFGTDYAGRDVGAQLVAGSTPVLLVAVLVSVISMAIAILVGMVAGFAGGAVDAWLMRLADVFLTIPGFPLLVILTSLLKVSDPLPIAVVLSITNWPGLARAIRAQMLSLVERDFVEAARISGLTRRHIIFRELLPNMAPYLAMNFVLGFNGAIYAEVGLYLLGVLPFTATNWGLMINFAVYQAGAMYSTSGMWYLLAPMGCIVLLQIGSVLFVRALEEVFNPRLRA
ncbi:MAG TPA: ABC transporter permease [Chloroflexota bacterium]|nr:ABC transporter permease [Chloroflexota bacterium]